MYRRVFSVSFFLLAIFIITPLFALPNPAAVYCDKLGFEYKVVKTPEGEKGVCVVGKDIEFNAWDFFRGKVGAEYSYCAQQGYDTENERKNQGGYFTECAVCVKASKDGEVEERIPMLELMGKNGEPLLKLDSKETDINKGGSDCKECQKQKEKSDTCPNKQNSPEKSKTLRRLPSSFDLRNYNGHSYIGDIRDQKTIGSCYAFGAAATAEGVYNYAMGLYDDGVRAKFSEAFIMWCLGNLPEYSDHFGGTDGADYDYMELEALTTNGICSSADFPYPASPLLYDDGCPSPEPDIQAVFSSWGRIPCGDIDAIKTAIMTYGVVDANVDSNYTEDRDSNFWLYTDGIYSDTYTACTATPCYYTYTDHTVALVGWDDNGGNGYWILRNSVGTGWGEDENDDGIGDGYMRISYTSARVTCQVAYLTYGEIPVKTFAPAEWFTSTAWNVDNSRYVVGGDFNGDGDDDIAVMYDYGGNEMGIWVFTANDDDTFSASAWYTTPSWNVDNTKYVVSGDFNGDGRDDLAAMYDYGSHEMGIWIFAADADNTFSPLPWYTTPSWNVDNTKYVVSGDFNGDGKDDLSAMYDYGNHEMGIWVFAADNDNTFSPSLWYTTPSWNVDNTKFVVSGNFNEEGKDDIAAMYDYGGNEMGIWVFVARNDSTFLPLPWYTTPSWNVDNTKYVVSGDFDGDGKNDIGAMYDYGNHEMGIWVFAAGNYSFSPLPWYTTPSWNVDNTKFMTSGDFNGDGKDDIGAMYDYGSSTMSLWSFITSDL